MSAQPAEIPVLKGQVTIDEVLRRMPTITQTSAYNSGMDSWSSGHSAKRICITCGGLADLKPPAECTEPRHAARYQVKLDKNNAYRRAKRAEARAAGTFYRLGRGNAENKTQYARRRHQELRAELFKLLGQRCATCGFSDTRALAIDHKNGGGNKHRKSAPTGTAYLRHLLDIPANELRAEFQVLCANCNAIKREELEEWRA